MPKVKQKVTASDWIVRALWSDNVIAFSMIWLAVCYRKLRPMQEVSTSVQTTHLPDLPAQAVCLTDPKFSALALWLARHWADHSDMLCFCPIKAMLARTRNLSISDQRQINSCPSWAILWNKALGHCWKKRMQGSGTSGPTRSVVSLCNFYIKS